jgi:hypothetical protein
MNPNTNFKFAWLCDRVIQSEGMRCERNELSELSYRLFVGRIRNYLIPAWGACDLDAVDSAAIRDFSEELQKRLKRSTVRQVLATLKRVLQHGCELGLLDRVPAIPRIHSDSAPRGGFDVHEYLALWKQARRMVNDPAREVSTHRDRRGGLFAKDLPLHPHIPAIIRFMVNCFIRPTDLKWMQHRHIQTVEGKHRYLRLELPESKRHITQIVSMRPAVRLYKAVQESALSRGVGSPNDYVFLPEIRDRKVAMMAIDLQFRRLLEQAGLRYGKRGQIRTLYSLRHTSIMFRLRYGRGIDLLTLARNARTSVEMIEKFYASELSAEMNIDLLQSRRTG